MSKIKYTQAQISELQRNKYVKNCTGKHIVFTKECKLETLKLEKTIGNSREIFQKLGFPDYVVYSDIPKNSISRWKRNIRNKSTVEENKGRPKKETIDFNNMTLEQENKYLKAENAYLKELKKLLEGNYP